MTSWNRIGAAAITACAVATSWAGAACAAPIEQETETATTTSSIVERSASGEHDHMIFASGVWGQVPWTLDVYGTLTIDGRDRHDAYGLQPWEDVIGRITTVRTLGHITVWMSQCLFENATNLTSIEGLSHWDVSHSTDFRYMFANCGKLESIDMLSGWDMSGARYLDYMFDDCTSLVEAAAIADWTLRDDVSIVHMFCEHVPLHTLGVPAAHKGGLHFVQQAQRGGMAAAMHCLSRFHSTPAVTWAQLEESMRTTPQDYVTGIVYHHINHD